LVVVEARWMPRNHQRVEMTRWWWWRAEEAEGTTNESRGLVGGGEGLREAKGTTNESRRLVGGGGGLREAEVVVEG
jgi:hypothetical protein